MARQNLLLQSEAIGTGSWIQFGAGVPCTQNVAVGPLGGPSTAVSMAIPATASCGWYQPISSATLPSGPVVLSCWVRTATGTAGVNLQYYDGTTSNSGANVTATTTWTRIFYAFTGTGNSSQNIAIGHSATQSTAGTVQIWGVQLEAGVTTPGDYVFTSTAIYVGIGNEPIRWSVGASSSGTGSVTPALPANYLDASILHLVVQTNGQNITTPTGTTQISSSPQANAVGGVAGTTQISIFQVNTTSGYTAPTIANPGDHVLAYFVTTTYASATINAQVGSVVTVPTTAVSIGAVTTSVASCLVYAFVANATDSATTQITAFTNASLSQLSAGSPTGSNTVSGNGGGIQFASGVLPSAGSSGATTGTLATVSAQALITMAMQPPSTGSVGNIAGAATVSAVGTAVTASAASVAGAATAQAVGASTAMSVGTIAGSGTASASGVGVTTTVGTVAGSASANGTGAQTRASVGSVAGTSSAAATSAGTTSAVGTIAASAALSGTGASTAASAASVAGSSTAAATGAKILGTVGTVVGSSAASGIGGSVSPAVGTIVGGAVASGTGASAVVTPAVGTVVGAASVGGAGSAVVHAVGTINGGSNVVAISGSVPHTPRYPGGRQQYATVTYFNFTPSPNTPYQFQPTLDGQLYTATVTWNLFGQRYYVNIFTLQGVLVVSIALIGSPLNYDISMTAGYFTTMLVYRTANTQFEVLSDPIVVAA